MQLYAYRNTERTAGNFVPDRGIDLSRRATPARPRPEPLPTPEADQYHKQPTPIERMSIPAQAKKLIGMVAAWHGLEVEDILGPRRRHPIIAARHDAIEAIYLNCRRGGRRYSLPEVGRALGNRDHTTILHALKKRGIPTARYSARLVALRSL
jgi:hypothetical protein